MRRLESGTAGKAARASRAAKRKRTPEPSHADRTATEAMAPRSVFLPPALTKHPGAAFTPRRKPGWGTQKVGPAPSEDGRKPGKRRYTTYERSVGRVLGVDMEHQQRNIVFGQRQGGKPQGVMLAHQKARAEAAAKARRDLQNMARDADQRAHVGAAPILRPRPNTASIDLDPFGRVIAQGARGALHWAARHPWEVLNPAGAIHRRAVSDVTRAATGHPGQSVRDIKTVTGVNVRHPLDQGPWWLAGNLAMTLIPTPIKGGRFVTRGIQALHEGATLADAARVAHASLQETGPIRQLVRGAKARSALENNPARNAFRAEIDRQVPNVAEATALKNEYDRALVTHAKKSGGPVHEAINAFQGVRTGAERQGLQNVTRKTLQEAALPEHLAPVDLSRGPVNPGLHRAVQESIDETDLSVFRQHKIDPEVLVRSIEQGAPGRYWYRDSGRMLLQLAGGDKQLADRFAQLVSVYSASRKPIENMQLAINAIREWKATREISTVGLAGTSKQIVKANKIMRGGGFKGLKTDRFYKNHLKYIDPVKYEDLFGQGESTHDIWMARLFGLKSKNPTTREYAAMEGMLQSLAVKTGWQPEELQAAMWISQKAQDEGTSVAQAALSFADALRHESGVVPFEAAPGRATSPDLYELYSKLTPAQQRVYTKQKAQLLNQFFRETGILGRLGHEGPGVFEGQINPGWSAYVAASRGLGPEMAIEVSEHGRAALDYVAAAIGEAFHQDAAAWFKPFFRTNIRAQDANGVLLTLGRTINPDEALALSNVFRGAGHDIAIVHSPEGAYLLNFSKAFKEDNPGFVRFVGASLDQVMPGQYEWGRFAHDGNYIERADYATTLQGSTAGPPDLLARAFTRLQGRSAAVDARHFGERAAAGRAAGFRERAGAALTRVVREETGAINPAFAKHLENGAPPHVATEVARIEAEIARVEAGPPTTAQARKLKALERDREQVLASFEGGAGQPPRKPPGQALWEAGGGVPEPRRTVTPEESAANREKVAKAMPHAQRVRRAQEHGYSQEWGKRVEKADEAFKQAGGGEQGYEAAVEELKGALPKLKIGSLTEEFDQAAVDDLINQAWNHPDLMFFERVRTTKALHRVLEGHVPQRNEIKLLDRVYGAEKTDEILKATPWAKKAAKYAAEVWNIPRSVAASFDLSAPFRQGLVALTRHPEIGFSNFRQMLKAAGSENMYDDVMKEIMSRQNFREGLYDKAGLSLADIGDMNPEEQYMFADLTERLTGGKKFSPVAASSRAYTAYLNKTRADVFDKLLAAAEAQGRSLEGKEGEKLLKDIAKYVNVATGRGSAGETMEKVTPILNSVLFSPRLMYSRLQTLNPVYYYRLDPFVRKQALQSLATTALAGGAVLGMLALAGFKIGWDPRNPDFLKARKGRTRIDPLGGLSQYLRAGAQFATAQAIDPVTGELSHRKRSFVVSRFFESKMNPSAGLVWHAADERTYAFKPFHFWNELADAVTPMMGADAAQVFADYGLAYAALAYGVGGLGVGIQSYGEAPQKNGEGGLPSRPLPTRVLPTRTLPTRTLP